MGFTRAVPKPISSKKREGLLIHVDGDYDQIKQLWNLINESPLKISLRSERAQLDASREEAKQTFYAVLMPAIRYEPAILVARPEYPGYVYLLQSLVTNGRYKLGESIHPRQRLQEVEDSYGERFKIIAVQYVATDRFAREVWLRAELVRWGCKRLEREALEMNDEQVEKFISFAE